jgi:hypothetical protein
MEIKLDSDVTNILPEGIKREWKRKQAYSIALNRAASGETASYHTAFSA